MPYAPAPRPRRGRTALIVGLALVVAVVFTSGLGAIAGYYYWRTSHIAIPFGSFGAPTATPSGTILLQDSLVSNTNGWPVHPPYCEFANGGYQISDRICYAPVGVFHNGSASAQAHQIQGPTNQSYGLVLRRASTGNFYVFGVAGEGYWTFYKVKDNNASAIVDWTPNDAIRRGLNLTNILLARFNGSHFDFFINSVEVGQADDSTFSSGNIGLESHANMQVVFNNFTLTIP